MMLIENFYTLDLDWEFPTQFQGSRPTDNIYYTFLVHVNKLNIVYMWIYYLKHKTFFKDLKQAFIPNNLLLSAAVSSDKATIDAAYEVAKISL